MATNINSYLNTYLNPYSSTSSSSSIFDINAARDTAKQQAQALLDKLQGKNTASQSLTTGTAQYLDQYSLSMKQLGKSADAVRGGNLDKLLYDKDGQITDDTVKKTVSAVQDMVNSYNDSLKLLNDNASRGTGTANQLARMARNPAPEAAMNLVGVSVNKDGTLALDTNMLTDKLKNSGTNELKSYKDILSGVGGLADGIRKDAISGSNVSAGALVNNDIAKIQSENTNEFAEMYNSIRGNAFALNNMAAAGMLMNILV